MTTEEAIRILDPKTTADALIEIDYYGGFHGQEAKIEAVNEACRMAVAVLRHEVGKNKPLTLEELRDMNDKPLWIQDLCHPDKSCFWICYWDRKKYLVLTGPHLGGYVLDSYGETWLAYRCNPGESAKQP